MVSVTVGAFSSLNTFWSSLILLISSSGLRISYSDDKFDIAVFWLIKPDSFNVLYGIIYAFGAAERDVWPQI